MWRILWFFLGSCRVRISGGSPEWTLQKLAAARIAFRDVCREDEFSCDLTIRQKDLARTEREVRCCMCDLLVLERAGFLHSFSGLFRRPLLLLLLAAAVSAAVFLPRFVFFYEVSGNCRVKSEVILRNLQELGVGFGTYGPSIKPQELKNRMLVRIPELQWLTVQQNGMRATVVVRERPEKEPVLDRKTPREVVASRSGVVTEVSCMEGNCIVAVGQAVTEGELLVSAYTDFGYKTRISAALAEVYAQTVRKSACTSPDQILCKQYSGRKQKRISLITGRKRWTLFSPQGSDEMNCDKQTTYRQLTLPGGFLLPLGIAITTISEYDIYVESADDAEVLARMRQDVCSYAQADMIAGQILSERDSVLHEDGIWKLESSLLCEEMIARMQPVRFTKDGLQ